jgi:hypothetical protein
MKKARTMPGIDGAPRHMASPLWAWGGWGPAGFDPHPAPDGPRGRGQMIESSNDFGDEVGAAIGRNPLLLVFWDSRFFWGLNASGATSDKCHVALRGPRPGTSGYSLALTD